MFMDALFGRYDDDDDDDDGTVSTELVPYVFDAELVEEPNCQIAWGRFCTNTNVTLVEDPYEADVNNNPGQMMFACPECYAELCDEI